MSTRRNKKKNKQPLKAALSGTEKTMLETKVRQIEKEMTEPTKMKIFGKIKNEVRWKNHRPDVLIKAIEKYMIAEEPKKKRNKSKTPSNQTNEPSTNLEHLNNPNRQFESFVFGGNTQPNTTNPSTANQMNGGNKTPYKIIDYAAGKKTNDRKRTFNEMNSENSNSGNTNKPETVYVDSTEGKRDLLHYANHSQKAREQLDEIIKDKLAEKHGKKRRRMNNSEDVASSDPIAAASNTSWEIVYTEETLSSVGGTDQIDDKLHDLIVSMQCDVWRFLGVSPPRSVLLHGPPGSGKTLLAHALAGECGVGLIKVSAPELVAGLSGQSEAKIRSLFESAVVNEPCIVFIDEIDVIANKRENAQRQMESRIVAQLLTCLDDIARQAMEKRVMFIAATNRPDSIDNALRRGDRFDYELTMGIPDMNARLKILKIITKNMKLEEEFDYVAIAKQTNGFVGADLKALTKTAGIVGVKRILKELDPFHDPRNNGTNSKEASDHSSSPHDDEHEDEEDEQEDKDQDEGKEASNHVNSSHDNEREDEEDEQEEKEEDEGTGDEEDEHAIDPKAALLARYKRIKLTEMQMRGHCIMESDFESALKTVEPSSRREGFATIPDVSWEDIGALADIQKELTLKITYRIKHKEIFSKLQIEDACGVILFGPPGCGKTLLAKAIAAASGASFISIKGPELLNKYVGESERAIRTVFERARSSPPCIVFFDELDALAPKREGGLDDIGGGGSGNNVSSRVVNQLLTELDGVKDRGEIFVIGATNRYDIIDTALIRPGRLGTKIYVGLPDEEGRYEILKAHTRNKPLKEAVDLRLIAAHAKCARFSGADLASLVEEAAMNVIKRRLNFDNLDEMGNEKDGAQRSVVKQDDELCLSMTDFFKALDVIKPSITEMQAQEYELMAKRCAHD
eukprot:CAMPEP_0197073950 /NCGR_PEP_ID=MMETSP1384-20130603/210863_1 /TAXON_ID=29189 /ORGANISM="Ammonia sp." /LENGTH=909 /DNA_ID=CAMNT_0042512791 /DNA_START=18 /DNA_END=2748 /DNA_ORIENTATION=+